MEGLRKKMRLISFSFSGPFFLLSAEGVWLDTSIYIMYISMRTNSNVLLDAASLKEDNRLKMFRHFLFLVSRRTAVREIFTHFVLSPFLRSLMGNVFSLSGSNSHGDCLTVSGGRYPSAIRNIVVIWSGIEML